MKPGTVNLTLYRGANLDELFTWYSDDAQTLPVDLTGWSGRAQFRPYGDDPTVAPSLDLPTGGPASGRVVLGNTAGTIAVQATPASLQAITWRKGVWALELTEPSGKVWALLAGEVKLTPDVVHA